MRLEYFQIQTFDELFSTQTTAKQFYNNSTLKHGTVISALYQLNGYGRNQSQWLGGYGNIAISIALNLSSKNYKIEQISYIAGVAIAETIKELNSNTRSELKWVNDVLYKNFKLAGILLEKVNDDFLLVGVGMNIKSNSEIDKLHSISLNEMGIHIEHGQLLDLFLKKFKEYFNEWLDFGFLPIRNLWLSYACYLNKSIIINFPDGSKLKGLFEGLASEGELILLTAIGEKKLISSGELFFVNTNNKFHK